MNYVVKASELYQRVKEMVDDGMDYVCIDLLEPDNSDPDCPIPASVHFEAFKSETTFEWVDYEYVDVTDSFN